MRIIKNYNYFLYPYVLQWFAQTTAVTIALDIHLASRHLTPTITDNYLVLFCSVEINREQDQ